MQGSLGRARAGILGRRRSHASLSLFAANGDEMLSRRAKYALRAMISLAARDEAGPASVTDIAEETGIPRAFLEQIFSDLKRRKLLSSTRGKHGGFTLGRAAKDITFAEIIRHIDGPLALAPCASRTAFEPCPECDDVRKCRIRPALLDARDATAAILEQTTLEQAIRRGSKERI